MLRQQLNDALKEAMKAKQRPSSLNPSAYSCRP